MSILNVILVAFLAVFAPALAYAQGALEKKDVHIAVGGKSSLYYLPLTIAEQLGYFKEEGLNITISDFAGGSQALRAVVGGSADVVSGAYEHTLNMQPKSQFLQCFVQQGRAPQIAIGIATSRAKNYKSPKDLKGLKVGVSAPGSSTNMILNSFIAKDGLKPSDVSIIGVGLGAGAVTALKTGQIDAVSNTDPVMTKLEQDGDVKIIADTRTLKGTEQVLGGPMPAGCLYAPVEFIRKNPNTVQALTNAIVRADKWIHSASPQDVLRTVPESYLLGDKALYLFSFNKVKEAISPDGYISDAGAKTALKVMPSFNPEIKASEIKLDLTYTNEFVKKANAKYK
ncbi:MAG TPA: ABC transporter substrate-binding protein [Burkholderiales bacterium]|nr:ABC transporter substrate-binding protein [Burkholderiales bacterium]